MAALVVRVTYVVDAHTVVVLGAPGTVLVMVLVEIHLVDVTVLQLWNLLQSDRAAAWEAAPTQAVTALLQAFCLREGRAC